MSAKPLNHEITLTFDDNVLIEFVRWHDGGETFMIFGLTGELLADALYSYLDQHSELGNIESIPPYPNKKA